MSDNTVLSDQEKANIWWGDLSAKDQWDLTVEYYPEGAGSLICEQILKIWRKETSPTTTDFEKVREWAKQSRYGTTWWNNLSEETMKELQAKYFPDTDLNSLKAHQIVEMWGIIRGDIPNTPTVKEGEEGFTKGEWYVSKDVRVDKNMCPVPFYEICNTSDITWIAQVSAGNLKENGEAEANAYLMAASKEMHMELKKQYSLLLRYYEVYNNIFSEDELKELRTAMYNILELLKKANPKLP